MPERRGLLEPAAGAAGGEGGAGWERVVVGGVSVGRSVRGRAQEVRIDLVECMNGRVRIVSICVPGPTRTWPMAPRRATRARRS